MDYIVLDIEFNGRKFASDLPMEVIEIGAVRLNSSLEAVDQFHSLIKPVYFAKLNSFIQKKTGIPQQDIDIAPRFPQVIKAFIEWINKSDEYMFITWGGEDMKRIVLDTRMHKLNDAYWLSCDYFDLLKGYIRHKGMTNDISVEGALADLDIPSEGNAHRALDDAIMTSYIFVKVFEYMDFSQKQQYIDTYTNAKERRYIKNAVRMMHSQKVDLTWNLFAEQFLKEKIKTDHPKKIAEIKQYFLDYAEKQKTKPIKPAKPDSEQAQQPDGTILSKKTDPIAETVHESGKP